jgi:hypothetical protein
MKAVILLRTQVINAASNMAVNVVSASAATQLWSLILSGNTIQLQGWWDKYRKSNPAAEQESMESYAWHLLN